eukprot:6475890-Prymnesium_polylepis.1
MGTRAGTLGTWPSSWRRPTPRPATVACWRLRALGRSHARQVRSSHTFWGLGAVGTGVWAFRFVRLGLRFTFWSDLLIHIGLFC